MGKDRKLWLEIQRQYAKLREDELGAEVLSPAAAQPHEPHEPHAAFAAETAARVSAEAVLLEEVKERPLFYRQGFREKHWVLICCSLMVMCEWLDRSVLSIAMEAIKQDFGMSDVQVGLLASASLWVVPLATGVMGRIADHLPRAKLLGAGVSLWSLSTFATGSSGSFEVAILCRVAAGLANCAGFPVAMALLCDHFEAEELSTAMGFYHAGSALGGLLGFMVGGSLVSSYGWRLAFWAVGAPQILVALLFFCTVPEGRGKAAPRGDWLSDLKTLLNLRSLRLLLLGWLLTGLLSGQGRFLSAFVQRRYDIEPSEIGLVMGPTLGVTGVVTGFAAGHLIDHCFRKSGSLRVNLFFAAGGDLLALLMGVLAVKAPSFLRLVLFSSLATACGALRQGVQAVVAAESAHCRGTVQGMLETMWAVGMGLGPMLAGWVSDLSLSDTCDDACALSTALLLFGSCGLFLRSLAWLGTALTTGRDRDHGQGNCDKVEPSVLGSLEVDDPDVPEWQSNDLRDVCDRTEKRTTG